MDFASRSVPLLFLDFNETCIFFDRISKNNQTSIFMKIHLVGAGLCHAAIFMKIHFSGSRVVPCRNFHENPFGGRRVVPCRQKDMTKLIAAYDNFAKAPKNTSRVFVKKC